MLGMTNYPLEKPVLLQNLEGGQKTGSDQRCNFRKLVKLDDGPHAQTLS